jgi:hypothetical protein
MAKSAQDNSNYLSSLCHPKFVATDSRGGVNRSYGGLSRSVLVLSHISVR